MGHDGEKPLTATYNTQRPPWIGLWSSRNYSGRTEWWKEPGAKDNLARNGRLRLVKTHLNEEDPEWFDPKVTRFKTTSKTFYMYKEIFTTVLTFQVPDGTSLSGPFGLDSKTHHNITKKGDQPENLEDFQQKVYEGSHQYKSIAEKFALSKEHPGLSVNPTLNDLINTPKWQLGRNALLPNSWYSFGPRFFDKPLNEDSFVKGFACTKYAAILLMPYTMLEIRALNTVTVKNFSPRTYLKRYAQLAPLPLSVAFAWGFSLSVAANVRNKDDIYNHFFASAAAGTVIATFKDNVALGITATMISTVLGVVWHYARVSETGLQGMVAHPQSGGIWGGPLVWKLFQHGDRKIPEDKY
uniref:NADH-ubiquinone oxidoreductase subunit B14.7 n=1 Tax=Heterorhabditis bacteriophora TaxID=37862 RepID=A0A1I7WV37_HETBA